MCLSLADCGCPHCHVSSYGDIPVHLLRRAPAGHRSARCRGRGGAGRPRAIEWQAVRPGLHKGEEMAITISWRHRICVQKMQSSPFFRLKMVVSAALAKP